jgi:hypothetical protein
MQEEVVQPKELWVVIPGMYEKWVNPANKNDKHYRVIYRSNTGKRRVGNEKFKTADAALAFADQLTLEKKVLDAV